MGVLALVDDAWLSHYPGLFTHKGWLVFVLADRALQVSAAKISKREYDELRAQQHNVPYYIVTLNGLNYWLYCDRVYADDQGLLAEEVYAVLVGLVDDDPRQQRIA